MRRNDIITGNCTADWERLYFLLTDIISRYHAVVEIIEDLRSGISGVHSDLITGTYDTVYNSLSDVRTLEDELVRYYRKYPQLYRSELEKQRADLNRRTSVLIVAMEDTKDQHALFSMMNLDNIWERRGLYGTLPLRRSGNL